MRESSVVTHIGREDRFQQIWTTDGKVSKVLSTWNCLPDVCSSTAGVCEAIIDAIRLCVSFCGHALLVQLSPQPSLPRKAREPNGLLARGDARLTMAYQRGIFRGFLRAPSSGRVAVAPICVSIAWCGAGFMTLQPIVRWIAVRLVRWRSLKDTDRVAWSSLPSCHGLDRARSVESGEDERRLCVDETAIL